MSMNCEVNPWSSMSLEPTLRRPSHSPCPPGGPPCRRIARARARTARMGPPADIQPACPSRGLGPQGPAAPRHGAPPEGHAGPPRGRGGRERGAGGRAEAVDVEVGSDGSTESNGVKQQIRRAVELHDDTHYLNVIKCQTSINIIKMIVFFHWNFYCPNI